MQSIIIIHKNEIFFLIYYLCYFDVQNFNSLTSSIFLYFSTTSISKQMYIINPIKTTMEVIKTGDKTNQ